MRAIKKFFALAAALTCIAGAVPAYSAAAGSEPATVSAGASSEAAFASIEAAAVYVRERMTARSREFVISVPKADGVKNADLLNKIIDLAVAETGVGNEGDYLRLSLKGHGAYILSKPDCVQFTVTVDYNDYAEEEAYVAGRIKEIAASLKVEGKSDYEKVKAVYDWITSHVSYARDISDDHVFTAYGALHDGKCVCQGFAQLEYRLLRELGVDVRMITGTGAGGGPHVWNIVSVEGWYYYIDATYDSGNAPSSYRYFLKGSSDFDAASASGGYHVAETGDPALPNLKPEYRSEAFKEAYPIRGKAFDPKSPAYRYTLGDADLDGSLTSFDCAAIRSGLIYGFGSERSRLAADADRDGEVRVNDLVLVKSFVMGKIERFDSAAS